MYRVFGLSQIQAEKGPPTSEEAYNFFTLNFEPEPQYEPEKIIMKRQKLKKKAERERDGEGEGDGDEQEDAEVDEDHRDANEDQVTFKDTTFVLERQLNKT